MPTSRPLVVLAATAALGGAFLAGTAVTGPGTASSPAGKTLAAGPGPVPAAAAGAPVGFADSCAELLAAYHERATALVGPWGWDQYGGPVLLRNELVIDDGFAVSRDLDMAFQARSAQPVAGLAEAAAAAPAAQRATSDDSGTNVQEAGVDEPDVVKTDGSLLVRLDDGVLTTYDVSGGSEPTELGRLVLDRARYGELLLVDETATVIAAQRDGSTRVLTVDLADPTAPSVTATSELSGTPLGVRLHGSAVRVVVANGLPDLPFVHPSRKRTDDEARKANQAIVRETTLDDWLPTLTESDATEPLVGCDAVAIPDEAAGLDTVAVVGFDAATPDERSVQGLLGTADVAYFSADHLYLASGNGGGWWGCCDVGRPMPFVDEPTFPGSRLADEDLAGTTTVHDLALDGTGTTYLASGRVDGYVADRWAMDEYAGVLRLALGPTHLTGNFNSVVTLEQDGPALVEIGRVDKLGVNEQIESVRWFDGLAIVVTFRQIDPLYAIDLTDAADPQLLGELKIPGFSEYLHPLGSMRMIGLGQGPTGERGRWGAQAGLFDVTDLTDPKRLDVLSYRANSQALAGVDPRQLTWLPDQRTILTVVAEGWAGRTGYVSVISLDDGEMTNRMVEVEHGSDVSEVRTVPLPDGRVVLVTGSEVSYFEVEAP